MTAAVVGVALGIGIGPVGASVAAQTAKENVVLSEWVVQPKPKVAKAGKVRVVAKNLGGEEHELVIARGKSAAALPTDANGGVDESAIESRIVGEIEDVPAQKSKKKTFTLKAGSYVLFCNIEEEEADTGEVESHFAQGMHAVLKVKQ